MAEITRRQMLAMTTLVIGAPGLGVSAARTPAIIVPF